MTKVDFAFPIPKTLQAPKGFSSPISNTLHRCGTNQTQAGVSPLEEELTVRFCQHPPPISRDSEIVQAGFAEITPRCPFQGIHPDTGHPKGRLSARASSDCHQAWATEPRG
ncbi:MAG: hypothetical protein MUO50_00075, partial [Longimicrobiales bacterium]|nr:hypothetical protein [Longimicrobiales bacterium]